MVDETKASDIAPAAPAVETSAPATTTETSQPSTTVPTPAASTEAASSSPEPAAVETKQEVAKTETPTPSEADGVLGAEPAVEKKDGKDAKASESKTPDAKPAEDSGKQAEKPALPSYDEFKVPEGITLEKEPLEAFTKILGEIETGKLDHKGMQEAGQKLVDLATKATTDSINRYTDSLVQYHKNNVNNRIKALKADPELGGENFEKTVGALQESVRTYGGTEAQIAEFRKEITESGLSASPAVCRLIYNMQQKINKYTTENNGPSIVPGQKPAAVKVKPYEAFYSGNRAS